MKATVKTAATTLGVVLLGSVRRDIEGLGGF